MKKMMITAALMVTIMVANAQEQKNYWVVETSAAGTSVVKIYDLNNQLVRQVDVGRRIDISRIKERKMLNRMLTDN
ncbi:MAG: hypothetical protein WDO14_12345 [Bacteroidota bacterium]